MPRLFVYGTFMRRGTNHHVLAEVDGELIGPAETLAERTMIDLGPYPALLPTAGGHGPVYGEQWEVSQKALEVLDLFERVPTLYRRDWIALREGEAFAYVLAVKPPEGAPVIKSGRYEARGVALAAGLLAEHFE